MSNAADARQLVMPHGLGPALPSGPGIAEPPVGGASAPGGLTPADIMRVLKQRKWLILFIAIGVYLLVGVATFLVWKFAPAYTSEAYIQLVPPSQGITAGMAAETNLTREYIERELATEASRMREPQILMEVLALPEVKQTEFYRWYGDNFEKCLKELGDLLSIAPVKDTYLVRVAIALKNPKESTLIVNKLVERHLARSRDSVADEGRRKNDTLRATKSGLEKELAENRSAMRGAASAGADTLPFLKRQQEIHAELRAVDGMKLMKG